MRATIGQWGWDVAGVPFGAPAEEVLARHADLLDRLPPGGLVEGWVTLVGHDLMSDELVVGASELARSRGVGMTFHLSPSSGRSRRATWRAPAAAVRPSRRGSACSAATCSSPTPSTSTTTSSRWSCVPTPPIAACPWAYLRLAQGVTVAGRHGELLRRGGRVALGCDSENAGDAVDILRAAALFVGLERDRSIDPFGFTAADGFALATISGAAAIGKRRRIGSIEVGKQADIVVHDTTGPAWLPRSIDPVRQLLWGIDGRSVSDVLVAGREVVRDGRCVTVDLDSLRVEAHAAA